MDTSSALSSIVSISEYTTSPYPISSPRTDFVHQLCCNLRDKRTGGKKRRSGGKKASVFAHLEFLCIFAY
jgi:hypothetical protein